MVSLTDPDFASIDDCFTARHPDHYTSISEPKTHAVFGDGLLATYESRMRIGSACLPENLSSIRIATRGMEDAQDWTSESHGFSEQPFKDMIALQR